MNQFLCDNIKWKLDFISDNEKLYDQKDRALANNLLNKKCSDAVIIQSIKAAYTIESRQELKSLKEKYCQTLKSLLKSYNIKLYIFTLKDEEMRRTISFRSKHLFLQSIHILCEEQKIKKIPLLTLENLWTQYLSEKKLIDIKCEEKIKTYRKRKSVYFPEKQNEGGKSFKLRRRKKLKTANKLKTKNEHDRDV